jgi:uncharacterized protein (UPF0332 family)
MVELDWVYWEKAVENLAAAQDDLTSSRHNSCASRCYYACFHAAIFALAREGIRPTGSPEKWGHEFVQSQFVGQLINRRKVQPTVLRNTLAANYAVRVTADYERDQVTATKAARALTRTEEFIDVTRRRDGRSL